MTDLNSAPNTETDLDSIKSIDDSLQRAEALGNWVKQHKKLKDLSDALDVAKAIPDDTARANALTYLAEHFSQEQTREALFLAQNIGDSKPRRRALGVLAEHLKPDESATKRIASVFKNAKWPLIASFLVLLLLFGVLVWVCWIWAMPRLWAWGFDMLGWHSVIAVVGLLYIAIIPFSAFVLFPVLAEFWAEYGSLREQVSSARDAQQKIEEELAAGDKQKLVRILSYSRQMLSEYYAIAMSQAQRSFRYCIIAMWIGFVLLIAGALDSFVPLSGAFNPTITDAPLGDPAAAPIEEAATTVSSSETPASKRQTLVIVTGAIIEFIAAAFLWVYRFSIQQQTYYYRRQLRLHNALLAYRLTDQMKDRDEATTKIVDQLMIEAEFSKIAAPSTTGIGSLLKNT